MLKIVFVCTGNTCRSPMAQAIFNHKIKNTNIQACASSYALFSPLCEPISENTKQALEEIGIDFSHTSVQVTKDSIEDADMIFGITQSHSRNLCAMFPSLSEKIYCFPTDISDPYGSDLSTYRKCRDEISQGIETIIKHIKENVK